MTSTLFGAFTLLGIFVFVFCCVVQPQQAALQEEGTEPHVPYVGIIASRERERDS